MMRVRPGIWHLPAFTAGFSVAIALAVLTGCADRHGIQAGLADPPDLGAQVASSVSAVAPASSASAGALAVPPASESARPPGAGAQALRQGIRLYQSGQYPQAEAQLKLALKAGLSHGKDTARAYKYLAFIDCTSQRESQCAAAFKAARAADPKFMLSPSEAGHPMWSQVYRKAMGLK